MGRKIPYEDIPKPSSDMPEGTFLFEVERLEEGTTKKGYACVNAQYRCVEPPEFAGRVAFELYTLGTESDPNADEPETLKKSMGMQNLKDHLAKAKVKGSNDMDKWFAAALGHKLIFWFKEKTDNKEFDRDGNRNPYFGTTRTRIQNAFAEGEVPLGEGGGDGKAPAAKGPGKTAGAPPKAAKPPVRAEEPEGDDDDAPPPPKKRRPADYEDDE